MLRISDVCNITSSRRIFQREYVEREVPFYRSKEIILKSKSQPITDTLYISRKRYEEIKSKYGVPTAGDILLTSVGTLGIPYLVQDDEEFYFKDGNLTWFKDYNGEIRSRFLYYWLLSPIAKGQINSIKIGSSQPAVTIDSLKGMTITVPPDDVQIMILGILSAYDDLIENNNRRIKILEEMALTIYDEWFVKFRFPSHGKVKMVNSELGKIPEGWEVRLLSDIVETQYGYTETASEEKVGPKFVRGKDINKTSYVDWQGVPYCKIDSDEYPKYKLKKGDIVVIRMADPGKVGIVEVDIDAVFASYLVRLKEPHNLLTTYYLFYTLLSDRYQSYISGASTGTTRKSASAGVLTGIKICIPPRKLLDMFEAQVEPLRNLLNNLVEKNSILCRTRDILLPKLISGEIGVEDLDIDVGDINDR